MCAYSNKWYRHAACRDRTSLDWHSTNPDEIELCRLICASCTVRTACLREAVEECDAWGVRGGLTPDERELIAGTAKVRILPSHGTNARYAKHGCRCRTCRHAHSRYERSRRQLH
ncbi:WhiB family transcriptional regulator [Amycolatopsis nivea]|uniref:WhiB family transcriptional regulator n=1 Tax=Amycolatopsis nivea TaxID=1644109 RepID=UPI0010704D8F